MSYLASSPGWQLKSHQRAFGENLDKISIVTRSSRKSSSSVLSAKLEQQQKQDELSIRAAAMKKRRQLAQEKLILELRAEEQRLEEELAVSEAKGKVLQELDDGRSMASKSHRSGASRSGASRGIRSDISSGTDIHALNAVVCHLKKPPSELQKFGGDPLLYHRFMRQFRSRVVANCESSEECLNYLEQYTTGEPQQIVIGYAYMDADKGYKAALYLGTKQIYGILQFRHLQ